MNEIEQEYLTFILDGEEFGVDILCVQELKVWSPVTEIPNTPDYLKGVVNLRGVIVPIVDLRERFDKQAIDYNATTVVIILRAVINNEQVVVGIVVDAVSDVYKVSEKDIRKAPDFGSHIDSRFIKGMAAIEEKLIILLDSDKLLDVEQLYTINNSISKAAS
ncbi:chemotaxis protein CheW [Oceanicoccus sagamiensis]|uniref:Chemotaxis protein CheW n=1 Tax=Oceanicoccus sagamiensis TaxID=716816 RepID=A0A1X9NCU7_9GAMM|nr:chemotaxis protein CheW [Oceanicoccus sagamiensis]ARN74981.1 chemotaxis protein CheW [Oceanicoccus sagamiensis]